MAKFELINHDVWGNDEEGYQVNDSWKIGEIEINSVDCDNEEIVEALKEFGFLKDSVTVEDIEVEGETEYSLYINEADTLKPLCELRRIQGE